jgi:hypothetical protein
MTTDDEKDPPIPSYLEGITLKRVHDGKVTGKQDDDGSSSPSS